MPANRFFMQRKYKLNFYFSLSSFPSPTFSRPPFSAPPSPGQCVRSFSASRVNSSCVVLLWSLQPNRSVPLSLVVEWSGQKHQDRPDQTPESRERWTRFPPTDKLLYLYGMYIYFLLYLAVSFPLSFFLSLSLFHSLSLTN
jgi:hypothetical protein